MDAEEVDRLRGELLKTLGAPKIVELVLPVIVSAVSAARIEERERIAQVIATGIEGYRDHLWEITNGGSPSQAVLTTAAQIAHAAGEAEAGRDDW